jgi:Holliday junction resolvasome RuvABC DNA-binding subunit
MFKGCGLGGGSSTKPKEEDVKELMSFGFTKEQVLNAMKKTDNKKELAADFLLSSSIDQKE